MIIALDFDGTCVTHEYPNIGQPIPWCLTTLQTLIANGHQIVLNTMRSGPELQEAINWFNDNGIPLYGINENPKQKSWTLSPKVYADIYIDDAALGCPLVKPETGKPFVNWLIVANMLEDLGYFKP